MTAGTDGDDTSLHDLVTRRNVLQFAGVATLTGLAGGTIGTEDGYDDCMEDIEAAKEYAEGRMCTEQFQKMQCPYDEEVTYGAANGCEISYLQGEGWDAVSPRDGNYTAVLDRFEEDGDHTTLAVLLLEDSGNSENSLDRANASSSSSDDEVVDEYVTEQDVLPEPARHEDAVLDVTLRDGELVAADYREEETRERKQDAQDRLDRLSKRLGDEDEDEDA